MAPTFNVGQRLILRCEVIVGAFDANGVPWARLIQFKAGWRADVPGWRCRLPGQADSGVFLYGPRRVHAIAGDTPSGLPAFPTTVGVNADDDRCRWPGLDLGAAQSRRQHRRQCLTSTCRVSQPVRQSCGTGWWLRLAIPSDSNGRKNIHFSGHGFIVGTVKEKGQPDQPLVRRVQLISENARVLVAETWSDTGQLPIRTAGPGAAIHRGQLRLQADVPRRDRGQPTPGDDAVTVAITVEHNEARLAGTLAFLDAGTNPARLRIYGGTRPATRRRRPQRDAGRDQLTKPAGTIAGDSSPDATGDGLITSTGVATWARLVTATKSRLWIWIAAAPTAMAM